MLKTNNNNNKNHLDFRNLNKTKTNKNIYMEKKTIKK